MARVQMLQQISGGRGDNTAWPDVGGHLDCDGDEAAALVRSGHARWADGAEPAVAATEPAAADGEPQDPENGSQDDDEPDDGSKPRVRDPKEAWELHAVQVHGVHPAAAAAMTKADLIAQFSNSPA